MLSSTTRPGCSRRGVADEPRRRVQLAPDVDAQRGRRGLADVGDGAVGDLEHPPRGREEALAGRGERDPAAVALEEAAEPGLEPRDALGKRLLGEVQRLRRPPEVPVVDHRHERPDLREIEIHDTTVAQPLVVTRATKLLDGGPPGWCLGACRHQHPPSARASTSTPEARHALHRLEQLFYDRVLRDPLLQPLFGDGQPQHVEHLTMFTAETFGGPDRFTRELGLPAPHRRPPRAADHRGAARALRRALPGRARRGGPARRRAVPRGRPRARRVRHPGRDAELQRGHGRGAAPAARGPALDVARRAVTPPGRRRRRL